MSRAKTVIVRSGTTMTVLDLVGSVSRVLRGRVLVVLSESPESRVQPQVLRCAVQGARGHPGNHSQLGKSLAAGVAPRGSVRGGGIVRVLYVCTANICRSASAQQLLREAVAGAPELAGVEVRSAGTAALVGAPGCAVAPALVGHASGHRSQPLTVELVGSADLIVTAARDHRAAILALDPRSRTRTFTIRQAGRIADWIVDAGMVAAAEERSAAARGGLRDSGEGAATGGGLTASGGGAARGPDASIGDAAWAERFPVGDPRRDVEALPDDLALRWLWIVNEMDAARGLVGQHSDAAATAPGATRHRLRIGRAGRSTGLRGVAAGWSPGDSSPGRGPGPDASHPDDVPDPHVLGMGLHPLAYELIAASTQSLVRLLREVASQH